MTLTGRDHLSMCVYAYTYMSPLNWLLILGKLPKSFLGFLSWIPGTLPQGCNPRAFNGVFKTGSGLKVWALGFRVCGLRFRAQGFWFRV